MMTLQVLPKSFIDPLIVFQTSGDLRELGGGGIDSAEIAGFMLITMTKNGKKMRRDFCISNENYD